MAEDGQKGRGLLSGSKSRRSRLEVGGSARGDEGGVSGGLVGAGGRRRPQRRKIPGKSQRREYTQSSTQMREDRYLHALALIRSDREVQELISQECRRYGVEPGGGKPSYGYSELMEMLLVRWAEDEVGVPGP